MADEPAEKRTKRHLKNAETVRERALKAQEEASKPKRQARLRKVGTVSTRPFRSIGRIFHYQPFTFIAKILRFIGRLIFPSYFRYSWRELRLVTWPSRTQTRQLTFAVLLFAIVFGALVAVVDYGLDKLFKQVLLK